MHANRASHSQRSGRIVETLFVILALMCLPVLLFGNWFVTAYGNPERIAANQSQRDSESGSATMDSESSQTDDTGLDADDPMLPDAPQDSGSPMDSEESTLTASSKDGMQTETVESPPTVESQTNETAENFADNGSTEENLKDDSSYLDSLAGTDNDPQGDLLDDNDADTTSEPPMDRGSPFAPDDDLLEPKANDVAVDMPPPPSVTVEALPDSVLVDDQTASAASVAAADSAGSTVTDLDSSIDDLLGGSDSAAQTDPIDDLLGGNDSAAQTDPVDDLLGGSDLTASEAPAPVPPVGAETTESATTTATTPPASESPESNVANDADDSANGLDLSNLLAQPESRTWTRTDGRTATAVFVRVEKNSDGDTLVVLSPLNSSREFKLLVDKLSKADVDYVKGLLKQSRPSSN